MFAPLVEYFFQAGCKSLVLFAVPAAVYLAVWKSRAKKGGAPLVFSAVAPGLVLLFYAALVVSILLVPDFDMGILDSGKFYFDVSFSPLRYYNLVPFKTLREQFAMLQANGLHSFDGLKMVLNLAANLFIFLPLPLLLRWNFKKIRWWQSLLVVFCSSLLIEVIQYPLHRSCDVDDLLVNTLGGLLGCFVCAAAVRIVQKRRAQKKAPPVQKKQV